MHRNIIIFVITFFISLAGFAQSGTLKGTVSDAMTGETIPMANIVVKSDGVTIMGGATDFDGNFTIKPINPGRYTVEISFIGYATIIQNNVLISPNKITFSDYQMSTESSILSEVQVIEYDVPLIDADKSGSTKTKEQITALPTRSVQNVAATTAGVYQEDTGGSLNVRGSRSNATAYYVDGVKIVGSSNVLPQSAIDQMTVVTGGLPAQYGDATGGIISITTQGPSRITRGGFELSSSNLTDPYNHNLLAFNLSGPIWRKKDTDRTPILGYLITAEYNHKEDPDPSAIGVPKLKDNILSELETNPSIFIGTPSYGDYTTSYAQNAAENLTSDDWDISDVKQNLSDQDLRLQGKLTLGISKDIDFIIGGSMRHNIDKGSSLWWRKQLLNSANNREYTRDSYNMYARLQHRLSGDDAAAAVKNVFYTLQADYSRYDSKLENPRHGTDYFAYNYVGKFTPSKDDTTFTFTDWWNWDAYDVYVLDQNGNRIPIDLDSDGIQDVDENDNLLWEQETQTGVLLQEYITYDFEPSNANPLLANYTSQYYDFFHSYLPNQNPTMNHIQFGGGLMNGDEPPSVYGLWWNTGYPNYFSFDYTDQRQRFTGSASADIGNHAVSFGFEYEKKRERYYRVYTPNLWPIARQLANQHLNNPQYYVDDYTQWQFAETNGDGVPLIFSTFYDVSEDNENYSTFAQNLREELGLSVNEWVYIDQYDPNLLSIDMFAADEILQGDYLNLYYYGYDHTGNEINERISFDTFLNEKDAKGDYTRRVSPFEPLYAAAYIQDKFALDDIVFNIGVRIDRFDANQEVLKDKYSFYPTLKASEVDPSLNPNSNPSNPSHPGNIGSDFVVYANSITDQTIITGYRDGDDWYNAEGVPVTDPSVLSMGSGVIPFLQNPNHIADENKGLTGDAFEDYTPQIAVMPRISFNFPISDEAMFFAHYDILTQRPPSDNIMNPFNYLFIDANTGGVSNPNLLPEKTTDYEVGFTQALTSYSAITISAFYRELSDMIQATRVAEAYPFPYTHFDNIDFGTVKGFSFGYDLRRRNNVSLTANYTLQFADGTGSSSTTAQQLVNDGFPNLRTTLPLDFDQRHNITANIDYRYSSGINYNGPVLFGKKILQGFGANLVISAGSGRPYSQQSNVLAVAQFGVNTRSTLEGSVNGAREPWTFRTDLRINKEVKFKLSEQRNLGMNVYMMIENLLNADNIVNVYRYTGNADDDGYLSSAEGQQYVSQQVNPSAFYDQYTLKVNNPDNYVRPRLIKLGMQVNF
jgi:outer membrane receptor protein involved in Fe transport